MGISIVVTGATGTAGSEVIRQALTDNSIDKVTAMVRRPLNLSHSKLNMVIHKDFMDYTGLTDLFKQNDACIWCQGISQSLVNKEEYIRLTYDYTLAAAQAMLNANPAISFIFLSGMGADPKEKSLTLFAWVKGKTENALQKLPLKKLYIARPGGIIPSNLKDHYHFKEKLALPLVRLFGFLFPKMAISSDQLAKAMLALAKTGSNKMILENKDLHEIVKGLIPAQK